MPRGNSRSRSPTAAAGGGAAAAGAEPARGRSPSQSAVEAADEAVRFKEWITQNAGNGELLARCVQHLQSLSNTTWVPDSAAADSAAALRNLVTLEGGVETAPVGITAALIEFVNSGAPAPAFVLSQDARFFQGQLIEEARKKEAAEARARKAEEELAALRSARELHAEVGARNAEVGARIPLRNRYGVLQDQAVREVLEEEPGARPAGNTYREAADRGAAMELVHMGFSIRAGQQMKDIQGLEAMKKPIVSTDALNLRLGAVINAQPAPAAVKELARQIVAEDIGALELQRDHLLEVANVAASGIGAKAIEHDLVSGVFSKLMGRGDDKFDFAKAVGKVQSRICDRITSYRRMDSTYAAEARRGGRGLQAKRDPDRFSSIKCYQCGQLGHYKSHCPNLPAGGGSGSGGSTAGAAAGN